MSNLKKFFAKELAEELEKQRVALTADFDASYAKLKCEYEEYKRSVESARKYRAFEVMYDPSYDGLEMRMRISEDMIRGIRDPVGLVENICKDMYYETVHQLKARYPYVFGNNRHEMVLSYEDLKDYYNKRIEKLK